MHVSLVLMVLYKSKSLAELDDCTNIVGHVARLRLKFLEYLRLIWYFLEFHFIGLNRL